MRCNDDVFQNGHSITTLDACRHRAEAFAQAVARDSGQQVDWHYSGGIANILYIGDHAAVLAAVAKNAPLLSADMPRKKDECGSCSGMSHRPGAMFAIQGPGDHGPYRQGDLLPDDVIAVVTT